MDTEEKGVLKLREPYVSSSVFRLLLRGEDTCTLDPLQLHTLTSCGFNSSNPLIIITHGWSVRSTPALFYTSLISATEQKTWDSTTGQGNMFKSQKHNEK